MRSTRPITSERTSPAVPPQPDTPVPAWEEFDAPAYTRALIPLSEIRRREAKEAVDRMGATNRTFNQRFWATLASEAGAVL